MPTRRDVLLGTLCCSIGAGMPADATPAHPLADIYAHAMELYRESCRAVMLSGDPNAGHYRGLYCRDMVPWAPLEEWLDFLDSMGSIPAIQRKFILEDALDSLRLAMGRTDGSESS